MASAKLLAEKARRDREERLKQECWREHCRAEYWQDRCEKLEEHHHRVVEIMSGYAQIEVIPALESNAFFKQSPPRHVVSPRAWEMLWCWFQCHKNTTVEMPVGEKMIWRGTPVVTSKVVEGREEASAIDVEWWEDLTREQAKRVVYEARHLLEATAGREDDGE